ncbi:sulfotransferase [candidate division KSB1 bacterium]|nr:sulfotransferase [candidate division KSB1 bacterium]
MLKRMLLVHHVIGSTFHKWISPVFTGIGLFTLHCIVSLGMALDHLFFPSLRKVKIVKPIIVVGNPRSGTTFLQRFLVDNHFGAGMRIWKMIYPSLTLQALIKPLLPLMEKFSPARHHAAAAHQTSLTGIETDDPSLMFRYFDGFFLYGFFLAWAKDDLRSMFDPDVRDTADRDFAWLEKMWRRNLIGEKRSRVTSKLFSLGIRVPRFLQKFPDAKILYMVRDPLQTVPSGLSLVTGVLDGRFGFWSLSEAKRQHYINRLYDAFLELSMRFYEDYTQGRIPKENVLIVPFPRIMQDFDKLANEILTFVEVEPTPDLIKAIEETAEKQRQFKSKHAYDLAKFGLDEDKIRKDYAPIYDTFLK